MALCKYEFEVSEPSTTHTNLVKLRTLLTSVDRCRYDCPWNSHLIFSPIQVLNRENGSHVCKDLGTKILLLALMVIRVAAG